MIEFESDREANDSFKKHQLDVVSTLLLLAAEDEEEERGPEGPKHKEWKVRYKKSLGKKLRAAGFTKNEISKIIKEFLKCLTKGGKRLQFCMWLFIIKNLWRLYKAYKAILAEYKDEGQPPPWNE